MGLGFRSIFPAVGALIAAACVTAYTVDHRTSGPLGVRDIAAADFASDDRSLLNSIALQVESKYYKPVDTRKLVRGEHDGLVDALKNRKLATSKVPAYSGSGDPDRDNAILDNVLETSLSAYQGKINATELTQGAIKGMLSVLGDPYTLYLTPKEITALEEQLRGGDFGGIGIYIIQDPRSGDILVDPIDGAPAARAGLKPGDRIVAVGDRKVRGMALENVEHLIRGKSGTTVTVVVRSHNSANTHSVAIRRDTIHVPSVKAKIEDNISYIRLGTFGDTSLAETKRAFEEGKRKNVRGFILDLRNNGGGLFEAGVDISSLMIPQGTIVSTIDRAGAKDTKSARGDAMGIRPLAVLVNKYTASASEITAGAIQDDRAGVIIGERTFGKGVVQSIFPLDSGAVKITTARYVTPNGRDIHHRGILPDRVVHQSDDPRLIDTAKDAQLNEAKKYIARWATH